MGLLRPRLFARIWVLACLVTSWSRAFPQVPITEPPTAPPAQVALVEGSATLERDGPAEFASATLPFVTGDRLGTAAGHVEVVFPDGAALYVSEYSVIDLVSPSRLRLASGRAILIVPREADQIVAVRYRLDTPFTSVTTGTYRTDAERPHRSSRADGFDRWAGNRYDGRTRARSAHYLTPGLWVHGRAFDQYGSWQYNAPHGYVWYPAVAPV